jgi:hypothetical protein
MASQNMIFARERRYDCRMANLIEACDWILGPSPRRFGFWERRRLCAVWKPLWLRFDRHDALHRVYADMPRLLQDGYLTWGMIIHANNALFEASRHDHPAEVLFSTLPLHKVKLETLEVAARRIFGLKGTQPEDPETRALAEHLTAETTRRYGMRVPRGLTDDLPCRCSSIMIFRRHLPRGILAGSILPLLVPTQEPYCVMVLPSQFWPEPFVQDWEAEIDARRSARSGS